MSAERFSVRCNGNDAWPDPWSDGPVFRTEAEARAHIPLLDSAEDCHYDVVRHVSTAIDDDPEMAPCDRCGYLHETDLLIARGESWLCQDCDEDRAQGFAG